MHKFVGLMMALVLTACSSNGDEDTYVARDVEVIYHYAMDELDKGRYSRAAVVFDEVERQHPYSVWARRGMLMSAYAHYRAGNYDDAVLACERFLQLHPGNSSAGYAHYLIAMSYYEQITDVGRDQRITEQAYQALQEVVARYPGSDYSRDAELKLYMTQDHLAGKELDVGRFYQTQNQYLASINRFRNVIERYQTTTHVEEALHRLVESYLALGLTVEAQQAAAVLGHNYPSGKWYRYSYNMLTSQNLRPVEPESSSWFGQLMKDIF